MRLWCHYRSPDGLDDILTCGNVCLSARPPGELVAMWRVIAALTTGDEGNTTWPLPTNSFILQREKCFLLTNILRKNFYFHYFLQISFFVSSWHFCGFMENIFLKNSPLVCMNEWKIITVVTWMLNLSSYRLFSVGQTAVLVVKYMGKELTRIRASNGGMLRYVKIWLWRMQIQLYIRWRQWMRMSDRILTNTDVP